MSYGHFFLGGGTMGNGQNLTLTREARKDGLRLHKRPKRVENAIPGRDGNVWTR
jgi:hypothetical protein